MAQFGVAWEDEAQWPSGGGNSGDPWWPRLDETPFDDDASYVSGPNGTGFSVKAFRTRLNGPLYDPGVHTGHIVRVRARREVGSGTFSVRLSQGDHLAGAVLITNFTGIAIGTSWQTFDLTLSTAAAGLITDYTDLSVRFTDTDGGGVQTFRVSAIELELPDAAATDGTFADQAEAEEDFDAQEVAGVSFAAAAEAFEHFGAPSAAGRLVAQGRRFRVVRTTVDLAPRAVPIVGRGR